MLFFLYRNITEAWVVEESLSTHISLPKSKSLKNNNKFNKIIKNRKKKPLNFKQWRKIFIIGVSDVKQCKEGHMNTPEAMSACGEEKIQLIFLFNTHQGCYLFFSLNLKIYKKKEKQKWATGRYS